MNVIPLMIFVSLALVTLAVLFFAFVVKEHTFEHSDRMELMPLLEDDPRPKEPESQQYQESQRESDLTDGTDNDSMSARDECRANTE